MKNFRNVALNQDDAWIRVQHSSILELHDRYKEALEMACHAFSLKPWYRPAVGERKVAIGHWFRNEPVQRLDCRTPRDGATRGHEQVDESNTQRPKEPEIPEEA